MNSAELTRYLVSVRDWYCRRLRARMTGKPFNEPYPKEPTNDNN